jgi:hypothetical protein
MSRLCPNRSAGRESDGELVRLPGPKGGFQVQRHRWKIERTLGWLIRYRRLARDYEGLPSSSEALIQIARDPALSDSLDSFSFVSNVVPTHSYIPNTKWDYQKHLERLSTLHVVIITCMQKKKTQFVHPKMNKLG